MNAAKRLFHIFALLSLCMQLTAHLSPVFAELNGNWQIQICSGNTFQTITIDENGNELPAAPTMRTHDCAFCVATSFTATPANNPYVISHALTPTKTHATIQSDSPLISKHGYAHATRGPPALS